MRGLVLPLLLSACTYTRAVTQTNVPQHRDHPVTVDEKRYVFFATADTDEVNSLTKKLQDKCPGGRVTGILTKDLRIDYFLFIFWAREVIATGYCQQHATAGLAEEEL